MPSLCHSHFPLPPQQSFSVSYSFFPPPSPIFLTTSTSYRNHEGNNNVLLPNLAGQYSISQPQNLNPNPTSVRRDNPRRTLLRHLRRHNHHLRLGHHRSWKHRLLAGPPFFDAVADMVGGASLVTVQGVDYPADIPRFLAGRDADGSKEMASLAQQAMTQCPYTKAVTAGYSQGGQLVPNAADMLGSDANNVAGAVILGDPGGLTDAFPKPWGLNTKVVSAM
ncbi:separase/separin [Zalerion maritima]|uniref:cutinase n=1 Tax=Zalerion maritima TaxID=339359 RepID=A0AAD5WUK8_9PEZI|nr:separase/separin [Zalerion maritima]